IHILISVPPPVSSTSSGWAARASKSSFIRPPRNREVDSSLCCGAFEMLWRSMLATGNRLAWPEGRCILAVKPLEGQVALVTGAGRRIGRAIALRLASEGARIALHYRNSESEGTAVATEIAAGGGEAVCLRAELTRTAEVASLFERADQRFGRLDILGNNPAVFAATALAETTDAQWDA